MTATRSSPALPAIAATVSERLGVCSLRDLSSDTKGRLTSVLE